MFENVLSCLVPPFACWHVPHFFSLTSFFPLVRLLHVAAAFLERALGIVVGLDGLPVFIDGAFALAGCVENLAQLQVAPNLGPSRLALAIERFALVIRRRLS